MPEAMITPKQLRKFLAPYRITDGKGLRLKDHGPHDTGGLASQEKQKAKDLLARGVDWLADAQGRLYADDRWSVLLIFQAMDAAGKDGTIKHVMSGVNPQGVQVVSFKAPSAEELDHDFMWRCLKVLPERGRIGIFNRSWYEEVLVVRVHEALLARQRIPAELVTRRIWAERCEDIVNIERYLARNGCLILKFFLNLSRGEQKKRFLERLDNPDKHWKFSTADARERGHWSAYMDAYESMIRRTATEHAPWYVVPADNKWFSRLVVAAAVVDALAGLDLRYPDVGPEKLKELAEAKRMLQQEED
ncbi:MAG: polyphosphate kinase 2 family protein [Krumholzibacteria bacterium]|nr:polyphosphate kinase 2 family protein [Candidatus Krumholzibacteria bacterium]